jgi:FkbM family methyltransferase
VHDGFAIAFATRRWEPYTTSVIARLLKPGDVFIDVGANVGYFTRLAADLVGRDGRVYAFEPEPDNFSALVSNARRYQNVYAIPAAVGDHDGLHKLFLNASSGCHSVVVLSDRFRWTPTVCFDTFAEAVGLTSIALVKIDAEGAEPAVLAGMKRSLDRGVVRAMVIEYAPQMLTTNATAQEPFVADLLRSYTVTVIEFSKYGSTPDALTPESLRALTTNMRAASDPTPGVNLLVVARDSVV